MVLMLVISVPLGWLAFKIRQAREQRIVVQQIRELGGVAMHCGGLEPREKWPLRVPSWLLKIRGDDFFRPINYVDLRGSKVTDAHLVCLRALPQLRAVHFRSSQVTEAGLVHLEALQQLQTLTAEEAKITDRGLVHVSKLSRLRNLNLNSTGVTDAGLACLRELTSLQRLTLEGTHVTDAGVAKLRAALPNTKISR